MNNNQPFLTQPISLDIPQMEGEEGYIGIYFSTILSVAALLRDPEIVKAPYKINYMVSLIISLIPDTEYRQRLRDQLKEIYNKKMIDLSEMKKVKPESLDYKDKESCLIEASIEEIGFVIEYVDKYIGISHKNRLGFVGEKTDLKEVNL